MIENILQGSKTEFKQRLTEAAAHIVSSTINEMRDLPDNSGFGLTRAEIEQMLNTWERHDLPPESYSIPEPHSVEGILRARLHPQPPEPEVPALHGPEEVNTARQPTRPAGLMPYDLALPPVNLKQAILQAYFDESVAEETVEEDLTIENFSPAEIVEFMVSEECGQLDELSKKTLGNYIQKASSDLEDSSFNRGHHATRANDTKGTTIHTTVTGALNKEQIRTDKRSQGIARAVSKLVKESVEAFMQTEEYTQLDEVSKKLLGRYVRKSHDYSTEWDKNIDKALDRDIRNIDHPNVKKAITKVAKRKAGVDTALNKLTGQSKVAAT